MVCCVSSLSSLLACSAAQPHSFWLHNSAPSFPIVTLIYDMVWTHSLAMTLALSPEYYFQHPSSCSPAATMGRGCSIPSRPRRPGPRDKGQGKPHAVSTPSSQSGKRSTWGGAGAWSWLNLLPCVLLLQRQTNPFLRAAPKVVTLTCKETWHSLRFYLWGDRTATGGAWRSSTIKLRR